MREAIPEKELDALCAAFLAAVPGRDMHFPAIAVSPRTEFDALVSRTTLWALHEDDYLDEWIRLARVGSSLKTELIPLERVSGWRIDAQTGNLVHASGKFFTVSGLTVRHRKAFEEIKWDQPIIEQPEVGILGILAMKIGGILHFCLQAKEEPGNIGAVQLSPTVQATYSNYTRVHGGASPPFLEFFLDPPPGKLLYGRLQTEDGGRFLYKSNRNMIVTLEEGCSVDLPEGFIWLTLRQIAGLMAKNDMVNACARSILSAFAFAGSFDPSAARRILEMACEHKRCGGLFDVSAAESAASWLGSVSADAQCISSTLQWIDDRKSINHIIAKRGNLNELQEWRMDGKGYISHLEGRFFRIVGLRVSSEKREVGHWCQPIIENQTSGIIGLLVRNAPGGREMLMQTKVDVGNRSIVQLGPTLQVTPGNYHGSRKLKKPFLLDEFSGRPRFPVLWENMQAEEGARFYREDHLHRVLILPDGHELEVPEEYRWVPVSHVRFILQYGEQVNSCARSVLSCLL